MAFLDFLPLIGNVLSGALNFGSSLSEADATLQAQREANETNKQLAREQMSYQTSERVASQAYNTPQAQRARYEQAGINPYLALGNITSGNTEFQTGVQPAQVQPAPNLGTSAALGSLGNTVGSALSDFQSYQYNKSKIDQVNIDNGIKSITLMNESLRQLQDLNQQRTEIEDKKMDIEVKRKRLDEIDTQIEIAKKNLIYLDEYNRARNDNERASANLKHSETQLNDAKAVYQRKMNKAFERLNAAQLRQIQAATDEAFSKVNLNAQLTEHEKKRIAETVANTQTALARNFGLTIDNAFKADMIIANLDYIESVTHATRGRDNVVNNWIAPFTGSVGTGAIGGALVKSIFK